MHSRTISGMLISHSEAQKPLFTPLCALDYRMKRVGLSEPMFSESSKEDDDEYNKVETSDFKKGFDNSVWYLVSEYSADKDINQKEFEETVMGEVGKLSDKNQKFFSFSLRRN